jgi:hypothetical protein
MAVGILSLVFYNDTIVKDYFARLNGTLSPATATPIEPSSIPQLEVIPAFDESKPIEAEQQHVEEVPAPQEETPAKPKRTPRKVAGK